MRFLLVLLLAIPLTSVGALPSKKKITAPENILAGSSALQGGQAGDGFSLIAANRMTLKNKNIERLSFEYGNLAMQKISGMPGYFHAQIKNGNKLVINFSQLHYTKFNQDQLKKSFENSAFVKSVKMVRDSEGKNLLLNVELKRQAKVRVTPIRGDGIKTSRVLFDFYTDSRKL